MNYTTEQLSNILKDVNPEKCFWINNGPVIRNIYELIIALKSVKKETFSYHVSRDKNDFSEWVKEVLKDNELAKDLLKTTDRNKSIKKIKKRVSHIEKEINKARKKQTTETKKVYEKKELSLERVFLELIISFILGLIAGIVIGILIEYYAVIPRGWF
ncbi:MAG: hypothetical protein V1740_02125 [Candidatus Woesearchaeota archaeon]